MRIFIVLTCIVGLVLPVAALAEDAFIGGLRNVQGTATVIRGQQKIPAENGTRIHLNDILVTGEDGALGVVFKDDTRISLGPDSQITITRFVYQPAQEKYGFISKMIRGTASYVSGAIGKKSPETVKFKTPVATIGIRGTAFLARVEPE
ncbi:MAG: hypothetical protein DSY89_04810 [Deltaproteobacteria bacterium]|nr:MAG: hypothetical protein DSY89_04810 [Deltaproteobacteria bacterium]